jgi:hypothetical protein
MDKSFSLRADLSTVSPAVSSPAAPLSRGTIPPPDTFPDINNSKYNRNLRLIPQTNIPRAGYGVQIINDVKKGTTLGLYLNHSNIPRVTGSRIRDHSNQSVYAVDFQGLARDAYDPASDSVSCTVACFNDLLDSSLDNVEFYVHPLRPHLLTV